MFATPDMDVWQRSRRSILHAFAPVALKNQIPVLHVSLQRWFASLDETISQGKPVEFEKNAVLLAFDFLGQVAFGIEFNVIENSEGDPRVLLNTLDRFLPESYRQAVNPLRKFMPIAEVKQSKVDKAAMNQLIIKFMAEAREHPVKVGDGERQLVSIYSGIERIENVSEGIKLSNFLAFVVGGYGTTPHGLAFTMYCLLTHPKFLERAVAEVDSVLSAWDQLPEYSNMVQLPYLTMCIKEALRLYSPATATGRQLTETKTIDGITLQKGEIVVIYAVSMNLNPRCWKDPLTYNPGRWTPEEEQSRPKAAFFTFSSGPRDCIAKTMALNDLILMTASVLRRYKCQIVPGYKFVFVTGYHNIMKNDLPLIMTKRDKEQ
jgi:cytochrome P450/NADPH-cytochrome P450 reductase